MRTQYLIFLVRFIVLGNKNNIFNSYGSKLSTEMVALRNIKTLVCRKLVVMFIFGPDLLINTFYERTNFTFLYKSNISHVPYSTISEYQQCYRKAIRSCYSFN